MPWPNKGGTEMRELALNKTIEAAAAIILIILFAATAGAETWREEMGETAERGFQADIRHCDDTISVHEQGGFRACMESHRKIRQEALDIHERLTKRALNNKEGELAYANNAML